MTVPSGAVGEELPATFGPVETTLTLQSYQLERRLVSYKHDVVHVTAAAAGSARSGGVLSVELELTLDEWRRLCNAASDGGPR